MGWIKLHLDNFIFSSFSKSKILHFMHALNIVFVKVKVAKLLIVS